MTEPFDVCGPLPTGVTVLEASAGTGKTYTIAALAARYVADGVLEVNGEFGSIEIDAAANRRSLTETIRPQTATSTTAPAIPLAAWLPLPL